MNMFEQVSSDDHQMSVAGRKGGEGVSPDASWVMFTWQPLPEQNDGRL